MASSLTHLKGSTYYIKSAINTGIIQNGDKAIIVDTGLDADWGKKVTKLLQENNMKPSSIINTHFHADHCGGNAFIQERFPVKTYAPGFDSKVIEWPVMEPFYLFSAAPLKELDVKFLKAPASKVDHELAIGNNEIDGIPLEILPLEGHSPGMIGVATVDNILFIGDAFFSIEILDKHGIPYNSDVKATLETLDRLKATNYELYVPSHGSPLTDPTETIDANSNKIKEIAAYILDMTADWLDREEIASRLVDKYSVKLSIP